MRHDGIRLSGRHQWWFYGIFVTLFVSGLLWWVFHNWFQTNGEFGTTVHPSEKWWLKLHGAAAMGALVIFGTLLPTHVKRAWRARRNRGNGLLMLIVSGLLIVTGYGLYYLGEEKIRALTSWAHTCMGLAFPVLLAAHIWVGRGSRKSVSKAEHGK